VVPDLGIARACSAILAVVWLAAAAPAAETASASKSHVVVIENMRFEPQTLTVKSGERVTWTNKDLFPHTATAEGKAFDSKAIEPNASWTFVAAKPGTYSYVCALHPTMKGRLMVE